MKILVLAGTAFTIMLSFDYMRRERLARFEYPVLILLSAAGMMLTISANDLISLYLALEFQSLALYVLAAFRRDRLRSTGRASNISCWARCRPGCCSTAPR